MLSRWSSRALQTRGRCKKRRRPRRGYFAMYGAVGLFRGLPYQHLRKNGSSSLKLPAWINTVSSIGKVSSQDSSTRDIPLWSPDTVCYRATVPVVQQGSTSLFPAGNAAPHAKTQVLLRGTPHFGAKRTCGLPEASATTWVYIWHIGVSVRRVASLLSWARQDACEL